MPTDRDGIEIRTVGEVGLFRQDILSVYRAAFSQPPYNETEEDFSRYAQHLDQHAERGGFRCVVALDGERMLGFAYGYRGEPGQYWHDLIRTHLGTELSQRWLGNAFELVEFAVDPALQGGGIGGRLHDALLEGLPNRTAVASTLLRDNPALAFYLRRGWTVIRDDLVYTSNGLPNAVIGLHLAQRGA